jgi:hypothetical protein
MLQPVAKNNDKSKFYGINDRKEGMKGEIRALTGKKQV